MQILIQIIRKRLMQILMQILMKPVLKIYPPITGAKNVNFVLKTRNFVSKSRKNEGFCMKTSN